MTRADTGARRRRLDPDFEFVGGSLCLDLANSVGGLRGARTIERIHSFEDLVAWGRAAGVCSPTRARMMLRSALRNPREANAVLTRAIALREAIYSVCLASIEGRRPRREDLTIVNRELSRTLGCRGIRPAGEGFLWVWSDSSGDRLDGLLGPVALSISEVLTGPDLPLLRRCASRACGWLFIDRSRNRSRTWCDMRACGNKAKAQRFRERRRRRRS